MKMKYFAAFLALSLTNVSAIEWDTITKEVRVKSQAISENLIAADHKQVEDDHFYSAYPQKIDSAESKKHRRQAQEDIKALEELVIPLVEENALELARNLFRFPPGVHVEENHFMTEPMTIFYKFTNLGLAGEILNSLRDQHHPNFSRYTNSEKREVAQQIMGYASAQAKIGSKFLQPRYAPNGYLFKQAVDISNLANSLVKKFDQ